MIPWSQREARTMKTPHAMRVVVTCFFALGPLVGAGSAAADSAEPAEDRSIPVLEAPPEELGAEDIERYWKTATDIEVGALTEEEGRDLDQLSRDLEHASDLFERVAEAPSGKPDGFWRAARAVWLSGEVLPLDATEAKLDRFQRANVLASMGIEANPDCGECMLWKFIAMGRTSTTGGMMDAMRALPEMAALLERAIELKPAHRDGDDNSTLGNLYYSSAIFNRIVPDWIFLKWMTGVRGDKKKGLAHSRKALELHPGRLDYRIEVGTQLLCLASTKRKSSRGAMLKQGRKIIGDAITSAPETEDERREIYFAKQLLEEPKKACGYTGDGIVDLDEEQSSLKKK